jgi:nicotinamidase/pyrazinamidase
MPLAAFWDVDTQRDFMLPGGKLYVKGAEKLRPNLRRLYLMARKARLPVVATEIVHAPGDEDLEVAPEHCLFGTEGQEKLPETLLPRRILVPVERGSVPPVNAGAQVILEKCHRDPFTNPCARDLVLKSGVDHFVVFGVMTDYAVRLSVLGLLKLGKRITVVSDAVAGMAEDSSRQAVIEMQAAGAEFRPTSAVLRMTAPPPARTERRKRATPAEAHRRGRAGGPLTRKG